ncbi:MAG: ribonuclease P protein component, partial [Lachnospiraceae bacterium]|nr:ribonuclease P protein component [Lachnospiraceae bacterium]
MAYSFPLTMRGFDSLKKNEEFQAVYRVRHNAADRNMIMYEAEGTGRIGIVCSKKVGNSVVRHRFLRVVREVYRRYGYDVPEYDAD